MRTSLVLAFVLATVLQAAVPSDTCRAETWVSNGSVNAILPVDSLVYIGGEFTQVGPYTGHAVAFSSTTGDTLATFPTVDGTTVNAVCPDGNGGWFIGGQFASVGGLQRYGLARILSDGTVDPSWAITVNSVNALTLSGTALYVGGTFTTAGGQSRTRIAAIDVSTASVTAWNPAANGEVTAIAVSGAVVYVAGAFTSIGGQTRNRIAALDASTGNATTWNPNASGTVRALVLSGSTVYVGGSFSTIGGQSRNHIAALDISTGSATTWDPGADGTVNAIAVGGSTIYAGGDFHTIGGASRDWIAYLNATTGLAEVAHPVFNNTVSCLLLSGTTLYVGGYFTDIDGEDRNRAAALNSASGSLLAWHPNTNDMVNCIGLSGTTVYVGGDFTSVKGVNRAYIAVLDARTGAATSAHPDADGTVRCLARGRNAVYVGGFFSTIGGQSRSRIASLDPATGAVTSWDPGANNAVFAVVPDADVVYLGGQFTSAGGQTRNRIAAIDASTGAATSWNPSANNIVYALAVHDTVVYAGGLFTSIGGQARNRIAGLDAATGGATTWSPVANAEVRALAVNDSSLYVGGYFSSIGGQARSRIAAFSMPTGDLADWSPAAGANVFSIALAGHAVYFSGSMGARAVAAADGSQSLWSTLVSNASTYPAYAVATSGSAVYVGGSSTNIGWRGHPCFAQFGDFEYAPVLDSISPHSGLDTSSTVSTSIHGNHFRDGAMVKLSRSGQSDIVATGLAVASEALITCVLNISGVLPGVWDVIVTNEDSKSDTLVGGFTVLSAPPALVSPADGAEGVGVTPTLVWHREADDSLYTLQVSASPTFSLRIINDNQITDTAVQIPPALLAAGTVYYWKVACTKKGGEVTSFCTQWSFNPSYGLPAAVVLSSPADSDTVHADSVQLAWAAATPAVDRYRVEFSTDPLFATSTSDSTVTDTTYMAHGLQNDSTVWWRVQAHNATGWGAWSAAASIVVRIPVAVGRRNAVPQAFTFGVTSNRGTVSYALPRASQVSLRLFSPNGQVHRVVSTHQAAGYYTVDLQSVASASGTYVVVFEAEGYSRTSPICLVR